MTMRAYSVDYPYRYRPAPIRAAFVLCHRDVHFCVRCGREIWPVRYAADYLGDGFAWMTDLIDTSGQRGAIQIPIAMRSILTPTQHPAVSSLEAYPTPAH
jgi:hypothetical protein